MSVYRATARHSDLGISRRQVLMLAGLSAVGFGSGVAYAEVTPATTTDAAAIPAIPAANTSEAAARATPQLKRYVQQVGGRVSISVLDRVTGQQVSVGTRRFTTASIVKVDILAALLLQHSKRGTALTASQRTLATKMITVSDNDAASELFDTIGGVEGLTAANKTLGLRETAPTPDWGGTTTTASDQVRLLQAISGKQSPLNASSREFVLKLMGDVVDEQAWGVPAAASDDASAVFVKNGWVTRSNDDNLWVVNTIGRVTENGHDWLVAVLSDHHKSQQNGITVVEEAAKLALTQLRV
jgi:beta-lactamase class A